MQPAAMDINALKERMRDTWMAGDFGVIAAYTAEAAKDFVTRLNIAPGTRVLDVACGTGNTAIPAARAGAEVTGVDIASNLLEQARTRAAKEGVTAKFEEGDAEQLQFSDGSFDAIISMFGAMFAPRPERVAAEFVRVCRPGGLIAMANWTPTGFVGENFRITANHVPPPPGIPAPVLWGEEATLRERFGKGVASVTCSKQMCIFKYPFTPAEVVKLFRQYFGPTKVGFSRLDVAGQAALASDLEGMWTKHNQAKDGTTVVNAEYLEVEAIRA
ncbi:MAG TPA: class I SAM-dependent methyltransferase [Terriglobales bacterium]|jgi:SAM-dependent methyltransferase|nr:class I SAM-dependent methyltransferase [Terriglobales bacterium]